MDSNRVGSRRIRSYSNGSKAEEEGEATTASDYRPISCCNSTYKAISKMLVRRLKVILPDVILPNQTAFVKGRLLIENTLLASEIVQGYHKLGGPKRITIKVDIAKAFDTIRWEFIFQCLRGLHLPEIYLRWIEACICSASFSVAFNGSTYGYFKGKRGLRQGDPLSPYLFVLSMNCLSIALCFADDLLIFTDGSIQSVAAILEVLSDFESRSGLAVSIQKTCLFSWSSSLHKETDYPAMCLPNPINQIKTPLLDYQIFILRWKVAIVIIGHCGNYKLLVKHLHSSQRLHH